MVLTNPSVLPVAAAIAVRTSRIRIGTFVLLLPFHDPVRVAEDAICIDILSSGRFDLGVGQGYRAEEFAALNIPRAERSARLAEAIELIHRLFKEKAITLRGQIQSRKRNDALSTTGAAGRTSNLDRLPHAEGD
jgi:alkanesulfonate monooxygenase SsuD/methylene tetrahydromethanopterin reductase-like flavin-dependent oxidoreductase (luciferase family)